MLHTNRGPIEPMDEGTADMEAPSYADMPLGEPGSTGMAGAGFELHEPARESETVTVGGWEVEVVGGQRIVVARGESESSYDDALTAGLLHAQKGLDLMSLRGGNNLMIKAFDDEHLVWWSDADATTVRLVSLAPVSIDVPPLTVTTTDATGNVMTQQHQSVVWHESFRYFRLSQTTDDLFDAYRNAYLALESVLSSIAPQLTNAAGKVVEGEGDWFKRALAAADRIVPLAPFVPVGTADPVSSLFDELYRDMRSSMSHAKSGRRVLLPQDESERQAVSESLKRLVGLYLRLAEQQLDARRLGGAMFAIAFRNSFAPTLEGMQVFVSNDESPFDPAGSVPNPGGGVLRELSPVGSAERGAGPFVVTRLWATAAGDVADLPFIRRAVGMVDGTLAMASVLEGRLILTGADRLEVMLGVKGSNTRQPRDRYSF